MPLFASMEPRTASALEHSVLTDLDRAGVALDYVLLTSNGIGESGALHREAARAGVAAASRSRRIDSQVCDGFSGRRMPVDDFYGWQFDRANRRLRVPAVHPAKGGFAAPLEPLRSTLDLDAVRRQPPYDIGFGPYRWADDDGSGDLIWPREAMAFVAGYARAFTEPPYPLEVTGRNLQNLFLRTDDLILHQPDTRTEIWWFDGGDWAEYFAAGLEWGEAWVATVRTSTSDFVAICASASD